MARPEDRYTDLLRHLAAPTTRDPAGLVDALREVERLHSFGHVTPAQLEDARRAYADTIARDPYQGPPLAPEVEPEDRT